MHSRLIKILLTLPGRQSIAVLIFVTHLLVVTPTGIEPVLPPWKGGVLAAWPRRHIWRRKRDSNPRELSLKRFSRPPRYGRFDIPPYWWRRLDLNQRSFTSHMRAKLDQNPSFRIASSCRWFLVKHGFTVRPFSPLGTSPYSFGCDFTLGHPPSTFAKAWISLNSQSQQLVVFLVSLRQEL